MLLVRCEKHLAAFETDAFRAALRAAEMEEGSENDLVLAMMADRDAVRHAAC